MLRTIATQCKQTKPNEILNILLERNTVNEKVIEAELSVGSLPIAATSAPTAAHSNSSLLQF